LEQRQHLLDRRRRRLPRVDARGATGEVAIRGAGLTPGYLNNDQANAESFVDGWVRTGDQVRIDDGCSGG
jgi:long-subunit acyl-CoA synthetase (AMP-forming)